jgi:hypothetical protein
MAQTLETLPGRPALFADDRDWGQLHTRKNLVLALAGEVGEPVALFQWLTPEAVTSIMDGPHLPQRVREEMAAVFEYQLRLADRLGVSLDQSLVEKRKINGLKYPVDRASGNSLKHTDL